MPQKRCPFLLVVPLLLTLGACAVSPPAPQRGVSFDPGTQRFSVHAAGVSRGQLLDELQRVAGIDVRPRPARDERLTLDADGLDTNELLARLLPPDSRYVVRLGAHDVPSTAPGGQSKRGAPTDAAADLPTKGKPGFRRVASGPTKMPADRVARQQRPMSPGPMVKAPPEMLLARQANAPKQPPAARVARGSLRVTLEFRDGAPPRVLDVQAIEGGAPMERLVRGPFLYAVRDAGGRFLQYGSFEDPLEMHSYTPAGPHSVLRASSGIAGISLDPGRLDAATLWVVDARTLSLPRELNDDAVTRIFAQGKPVPVAPAARLLRGVDQETPR